MINRETRRIILRLIVTITLTLCFAASAFAFDKVIFANADPFKYYVQVDTQNNIVTVFSLDDNGKFTKIAKQFICTVGASGTPTPTGTFKLNESRRRFGYFQEFGVYAQYWTNVAGGIFFHSILYTKPKEGSFTRSSYNNLGRAGSHGCIRLLVEDARWIYYNCPAGTRGIIVKGEKNEALRKSLLPKVSASKYKPASDQYEAVKRSLPMAKLRSDATFTSVSGKKSKIQKGALVSVVSSGQGNCRVKVNGVEGHIDTQYLSFIPNGPSDVTKNAQEEKKTIKVYEISSAQSNFYERATPSGNVLAVYGKGTEMTYVGETTSFYKVRIEGEVGYVYKKDVKSSYAARDEGYKPKVYKVLDSHSSDEFFDMTQYEESQGNSAKTVGKTAQTSPSPVPSVSPSPSPEFSPVTTANPDDDWEEIG